jgi:hypothetical protein
MIIFVCLEFGAFKESGSGRVDPRCQGLVFHFAYNMRDKISMSNDSGNLEGGIKESVQQQLLIIVFKA